MRDATRLITAYTPGLVPYGEALAWQIETHAAVVKDPSRGVLAMLEHPPVLTLGKNASLEHLLFSNEYFARLGVDIQKIERGGEVTAHMPGQVVLYPILPIGAWRLSPRQYVWELEEAVIQLLKEYNIESARDPEYPGVWVGGAKVCALGLRIKERVSMHGLALNVSNDLELFAKIVPCGIQGRAVTSMKALLGEALEPQAVGQTLASILSSRLTAKLVWA